MKLTDKTRAFLVMIILSLLAPIACAIENQITDISPNFGYQGQSLLEMTLTLDTDTPSAPPAAQVPDSVTVGSISAASISHDSQYIVSMTLDIPSDEELGTKDVTVTFTTEKGELNFVLSDGFTVLSGSSVAPVISQQPQSQTVPSGSSVTFSVTAWGTDSLSYQWYRDDESLSGAVESSLTIDAVTISDAGDYSCVITNDFGAVTSTAASLTVTTDSPYEGYNLFAPMQSAETYLMDNDGNIVKTWTSDYSPALSAYLLEDGTLLRTADTNNMDFDAGGAGGRLEQYDWDGNLLWSYDYSSSDYCLHHDVEMLPDGNILMIAWESKSESEMTAAGADLSVHTAGTLWPDHIIEVQPSGTSGGTIVWQWHAWDHLIQDYDETKSNYGVVADHPEKIDLNCAMNGSEDWNHINSVDYNAELDQIVLSVHNFSEIWIIDHHTTTAEAAGAAGDLLYRWGNPQAYDRGDSTDQQLFVQHDAEWIESGLSGEGDILIFNNGKGRSDGNYSSVDQVTPPCNADGTYDTDTSRAFEPNALTWTYPQQADTSFYAQKISGCQRLPNGHTLICQGPDGYFFEVTSQGQLVWDYSYDGEVFRVERYGTDYAGFVGTELEPETLSELKYPVVDTAQIQCYNNASEITSPAEDDDFYGQDAQFDGHQPSYTLSDDGLTVYDNVTELTWTQTADLDGDGDIDADDKLTYDEAVDYPETLNAQSYGGYSDWRLPSIKELYSLMNFTGQDPSSVTGDTSDLAPFVDTDYFGFNYGDTEAGERIIDAQWASSTLYVSTTMDGNETMFGLNLADGRIKGYPTSKTFYIYLVRGNTDYGVNNFVDNGDGTISDKATGLMWSQDDCGAISGTGPRSGMNWKEALVWVQAKNAGNYLGYSDWRLPNAKEMQSLVDYTRSPDTTSSAAIDAVFNATEITNEAGESDYPWYWTGTTHTAYGGSGTSGAYICFGRAIGYWSDIWQDVHGAGCQRSDRKSGDLDSMTGYTYVSDGYYFENSPQGDSTRINNYVRLVRDTACGDPGYASPLAGDLNDDCYVNLLDVNRLSGDWQDVYGMDDVMTIAENWLDCIDPGEPCSFSY